ncbi:MULTISPECIES: amyloid fiber anchoring/assembly protein TapA [Bacillaceae]|uniref:Amyloid fiber anchoring/assembly protein TapA n=1 Tax=Evansella alkalicola TaxID=745819 RepID=A0ABS6JW50_9BACI|nr:MULTISPECIES: amyloid fiber anchoring/assembly protein TapA [Bacillaceae]MBU9722452.1 amyloid fiber anchoring/assembly protein TapA [Bacillus alkalicola]
MVRSLRIAKNKSRFKKVVILAQVLAIWYATVFSLSLLTSGTEAYYSNKNNTQVTISSAEYWWDGSDLDFTSKKTQNLKVCAPTYISVELKNRGEDMTSPTTFEVYYVESGNPSNKHGEKVYEGTIDHLAAGERVELEYEAEENGFYKFKAYQLPDYEGKNEEIWSEKVHVNCNASKDNNEEVEEDNGDVIEQEVENEIDESEKTSDEAKKKDDSVEDKKEAEQQEESKDESEGDSKSKEDKDTSDDIEKDKDAEKEKENIKDQEQNEEEKESKDSNADKQTDGGGD